MKWPNQHTIVFIGLFLISTTGLQQVPVKIEGKDPKPAQLITLIEHAKKSTSISSLRNRSFHPAALR